MADATTGYDDILGVCLAVDNADLVSRVTPAAEPAAAATDPGNATTDATGATVTGTAGDTADVAAGNRRGGGDGRATALREAQEEQEDLALAVPFVPLLVPTPDTTGRRLSAFFMQPPPPIAAPLLPTTLGVVPKASVKDIPAALRNYAASFEASTKAARSTYERIIAEGSAQTAQLNTVCEQAQDDAQRVLDKGLDRLDLQLAQDRGVLFDGERASLDRLGMIADTSRLLVRSAAARALGTVAARKRAIEARTNQANTAADDVVRMLDWFLGEVDRAGPAAAAAFAGLGANPAGAQFPKGGKPGAYDPEMSQAMNEPLDPVVVARANNRNAAFAQAQGIFGSHLNDAHTQFMDSRRSAFAPFQSYIDMLGTTAPKQIAKLRRNAIKVIDRMEKRGKRTILESRNRSEIVLVQRHRQARQQLTDQVQSATTGQNRAIERAALGQSRGYSALVGAQGITIAALRDQIASQRALPGDAFARFVIEGSARTTERTGDLANDRVQAMAGTGARMRQSMTVRIGQAGKVQEKGVYALTGQLHQLAGQASDALMRNTLAQESSLRQQAEPVAQSVDSFRIPAAAELTQMENALWDRLTQSQQAANAAYYGGTPPGGGGGGGTSTTAPPPEGTGTLPSEYVTKSDRFTATPGLEDRIVEMSNLIGDGVISNVGWRVRGLKGQMTITGQNPKETLSFLHGLTSKRGSAVDAQYKGERGSSLWDDIPYYMSFGNPLTGVDTRIYSGTAALNYLAGNRAAGALNEVQAAVEWTNDGDQAIDTLTFLDAADMSQLRGLPGAESILADVESDLGGADGRAFHILREATDANALESVAQARAIRTTERIEGGFGNSAESGANNAFDQMNIVAQQAGGTRLEGADEFGLTTRPPPPAPPPPAAEAVVVAEPAPLVSTPDDPTTSTISQVTLAAPPVADAVSSAAPIVAPPPPVAPPLPTDYRVEGREERTARSQAAYQDVMARLGNDGARRADGAKGGADWLVALASRERVYSQGEGDVSIETVRPEQRQLLRNMAELGPNNPLTRGARIWAEETRPGGPDRQRFESTIYNPGTNLSMANPDDPAANSSHMSGPSQAETDYNRAMAEDAEMYQAYDCYRRGVVPNHENYRDVTTIKSELVTRIRASVSDERAGRLMGLQITEGPNSPRAAALAFEHAVDRWGTNESLLKDTFRRMSRDEIAAAVAEYDAHHDPGLYARLGLFNHSNDWFTELSGDDRIEMQTLAMGNPRNERERIEVSRMTSKLQKDNSTWVGHLLARAEYRDLERSHDAVLTLAQVTDADFDDFGVLRTRDGVRLGNFDAQGNLRTDPNNPFDMIGHSNIIETNIANAAAYRTATDNIANAISTAIVAAAAIISTAATFGAAASFWIPVLVTLEAGIYAMAVNWAIKGGRYGYEDMGRDFGLTLVQAATAGFAAALSIGATGGMAALRTALTSRLISTVGFRATTLVEEALIGGAAGAFGGAGNALFDDEAWDSGHWGAGIGHGALRGFGGGFLGAAATGATVRALGAGANQFGRAVGARNAINAGKSGFAVGRAAVTTGRAAQNSFGTRLAGRVIGGGIGGSVTRAYEINYDRQRGKYRGSYSQAMDEIYTAGAQNAIQSFGEGLGEHAAEHGASGGKWRDHWVGAPTDVPRTPVRAEAPSAHTDESAGPIRPRTENDTEPVARAALVREARVEDSQRSAAAGHEDADLRRSGTHPDAANDNVDGQIRASPARDGEPRVDITRARMGAPDESDVLTVRAPHTETDTPTGEYPALTKEQVDAAIKARDERLAQPRSIAEHLAANDGDLRPLRGTADLNGELMFRIGAMPIGSHIQASDPKSPAAARRNYDFLRSLSPNLEVMLVFHPGTGEYMVVQGGPFSARKPSAEWIVERHSHPHIISDDLNAQLVRSMPSATDGDFAVLKSEVDRMARGLPEGTIVSRRSSIDINVNGVASETHFEITRMGNGAYELKVTFNHPQDGNTTIGPFNNIAHYEHYALQLTGVDFSSPGAETVRSVQTGGGDRPPGPPRAARGEMITPDQRATALTVGERMERAAQAREELAGQRPRGDYDPEIAAAAHALDAQAGARKLGLVGEPDSMIRLHAIINDPSIPPDVRAAVARAALDATRFDMVQAGTLRAGDELMMFFHGAPADQAASYDRVGIDMSRVKGGTDDDAGRGLYGSQDLHSAAGYLGEGGQVFPVIVRRSELGNVIDVRPGTPLGERWSTFLRASLSHPDARTFGKIVPIAGRPYLAEHSLFPHPAMAFGPEGAGRGLRFEAFLARMAADPTLPPELRAAAADPHITLMDLGGIASWGNDRGMITDQLAIHNQRVADLFNEQMGFPKPGQLAHEDAGPTIVRSVDAPQQSAAKSPGELAALRTRFLKAFDLAIADRNMSIQTELQDNFARLRHLNPDEIVTFFTETWQGSRRKIGNEMSAQMLGAQMAAGVENWPHIEGTMRDLFFLEARVGPRLREVYAHLTTSADPAYVAPAVSARMAQAVADSPLLTHIVTTQPALFADLEAKYFQNYPLGSQSAAAIETYVVSSLSSRRRSSDPAKAAIARGLYDDSKLLRPAILSEEEGRNFAIHTVDKEVAPRPKTDKEPSVAKPLPEFAGRMPITDPATIKPGQFIDHLEFGRGTVIAVKGDVLNVLLISQSPDAAPVQIRLDDEKTYSARNEYATDDLPVAAIATDAEVKAQQARIDQIRVTEDFGPYTNATGAGTVSIAAGGGEFAVGTNSTLTARSVNLTNRDRADLLACIKSLGLDPNGTTKDGQFVHHAELASLFSLRAVLRDKGKRFPAVVDLFVDRDTCNSCKTNLDLVAAYLGIAEIRVYPRKQPLLIRRARQ